MTYRRDSDVPVSHGLVVRKIGTHVPVSTDEKLANHSLKIPPKKLKKMRAVFLRGKTKLMAWTASHLNCKSPGGREELVRRLEEFLPVDKYGNCGPFNCSKGRFEHNAIYSCYKEHGARYKFYLAFENSLCVDYVTEKFFLPLLNRMVPIVYGDADYSLYGPPGSYINALDFPSVKELAAHIQFLDVNPREYLKYFLWTDFYRIELHWPTIDSLSLVIYAKN